MNKNDEKYLGLCSGRGYKVGFTLIEIMVVLFILLAMFGATVVGYNSFLESGKKQTTKQYIANLDTAIRGYSLNVGKYPSALQDLISCPSDVSPNKWGTEPYLRTLQQTDPWQNEYRYITPGQHVKEFDVWSPGPDGQDGTEDDIGNWPD
ncbi:MAG: type II secretion system major pseudopilin GspG [Planctomycetaceae bacterium]|jgi:general secretion pathway protein G|nr:type II secretion system major pseudopilin GspG [Planctomycetaceae bacterium]